MSYFREYIDDDKHKISLAQSVRTVLKKMDISTFIVECQEKKIIYSIYGFGVRRFIRSFAKLKNTEIVSI
jgi:hypothetical protein